MLDQVHRYGWPSISGARTLQSTERLGKAHKWEDPFVRRKTNPFKQSGTAAADKPVVSSLKRRRAFSVIRKRQART